MVFGDLLGSDDSAEHEAIEEVADSLEEASSVEISKETDILRNVYLVVNDIDGSELYSRKVGNYLMDSQKAIDWRVYPLRAQWESKFHDKGVWASDDVPVDY